VPEPELSKVWFYTLEHYQEDKAAGADTVFMSMLEKAMAYWVTMNNPSAQNWAAISFYWY
jgi:hypothetical protein